MKIIKAEIVERYIHTENGIKQGTKELIHESRYFSSMETFEEWYSSFSDQLWEDDGNKVKFVEGVYVRYSEIELDDMSLPKQLREHATFRSDVSYYYARKSA